MSDKLLLRIAEAASDYLMGLKYDEFAKEHGGADTLKNELQEAVDAWEATPSA